MASQLDQRHSFPKSAPARLVIPALRCHDITAFIWDDLFCTLSYHPYRANHTRPGNLRTRAITKTPFGTLLLAAIDNWPPVWYTEGRQMERCCPEGWQSGLLRRS